MITQSRYEAELQRRNDLMIDHAHDQFVVGVCGDRVKGPEMLFPEDSGIRRIGQGILRNELHNRSQIRAPGRPDHNGVTGHVSV
jgi:hypothetical protein